MEFQLQGKSRKCSIQLLPEDNLSIAHLNLPSFDVITCDGPYGILEPGCEWDDFDLDTKQGRERYYRYYQTLFNACLPFLKDSGSLFVFNYSEGASIIKGVLDENFSVCFRRWLSWTYENHFDFDGNTNFQRSHEAILYYTKKSDGFVFKGKNIPDVISYPIIKIDSHYFKAGAKPIEVIRYLLKIVAVSGGCLLSLFAGSGTDLIVAAENDMDSVGFEFNPEHRKIITQRIMEIGK